MKQKRCPTCGRGYVDETLNFCLDDGAVLVYGPADGPSTAVLPAEAPTRTLGVAETGDGSHEGFEKQSSKPRSDKKFILLSATALSILALIAIAVYVYRTTPAGAKQIESIAVLPFSNESGNADVEYLSDGMTEILIGSLSQLPNLNVKARTSVFRYKGKEFDTRQIGKELNVQAIVTGRVVQRGERLTLFVELIDAATENVLWKTDYSRAMTELVSLHNDIAQDVSQKLRTKLSAAEAQKLVKKSDTTNPDAYRLYLQGRYFWNKRRIEAMGKAIGYFQQAIELDPNYALAYSGLADAVAQPSDIVPPLERADKARTAAQKALSLDPDLAEAHTALAHILIRYDLDFAGAERELNHALELDPKWIDTYQRLGELYLIQGRFDEGLTKTRQGLEIEPFSLPLNTAYGALLVYSRRYDEGIAQLNKAINLDPDHRNAHIALVTAYSLKGMYGEATQHRVTALRIANQEKWADRIAEGFAKDGWKGVLTADIERYQSGGYSADRLPNYNVAVLYTMLGEKDKAFEALEEGIRAKEQPSLVYIRVDPRLDPLRGDPRFDEIVSRVGFPK